MSEKTEKFSCPPTISYVSFTAFLNQLRNMEHVPHRIDKTLMPKASGSQQSSTIAALKYLKLIDATGKPIDGDLEAYVLADDDARKPIIAEILRKSYSFVFDDRTFDLEKATTGQMAEKFRSQDLTGSTITKTIQFFLAAAKDAGIKVSPHIKPPPIDRSKAGTRKSPKKDAAPKPPAPNAFGGDDDEDDDDDSSDTLKFEVPIPGKRSVKVIVPNDLDGEDWGMLQQMITVYINRWKGFKPKSNESDLT